MRPTLLDLLPEALRAHQAPDPGEPTGFLVDPATADLLKAFEKVLLGRPDGVAEPALGLEQIVDGLARYFTPGTSAADGTPDEFLPWLSQWVALSLRTDIFQADGTIGQAQAEALNLGKRRRFIGRMAYLYRIRGTRQSMQELLEIFTGAAVTIDDQVDGEPHFFKVLLNLEALKGSGSRAAFERAKELAHSVIRLEKPAHTRYLLVPLVVTMRIGRGWPAAPDRTAYYIRVGDNTRLGYKPNP
jgi:phage tail-like protein